ncbi:MAG: hypothetical protein HYY25_00770 [Candidatus Wallbacteria bacterium]|nr:hypothetical protein [Candidatus Wallbacteria bacterium]
MKHPARSPRGKTLLAFASFVLLVVVVVNLTGWALWQFTSDLLTESLDRHLTAIAGLVSRELEGDILVHLKPGDEKTSTYLRLRHELSALRTSFHLADLFVFDSENRVLVSSGGDEPIGTPNPALQLDADEILDAWMGKPAISPVIARGGQMLKTGYAPVHDRARRIVAVLGVETDVRFFDTLSLLRNGLVLATALALVAIGGLALVFRRLLRELLLAEEKNQETERLALVGHLSAQICHEIRNPLSIISSSAEFLVRRIDKLGTPDDKVRELVGYVISEIERLDGIVTRFLEVARPIQVELAPRKLGELLGPLFEFVGPELDKAGIRLEAPQVAADVVVRMDIACMRQVLLNAVLNARDAMIDSPRRQLTLSVVRDRPDRVVIQLDDTGTGLPDEILGEAFAPFVTTKPAGTGLGLFVAKRIVDQHDGEIRIENLSDGGARFVVELPVDQRG